MTKIIVSDPTLRDGSHAIRHQLNGSQIAAYAMAAESAGIPIVEVGHGNGIGASSLQLGESLLSDQEMLRIAKGNLVKTKLGIHVIPGFATINRDLSMAIDAGVDVIRVASHSTEADTTCRHIGYARQRGREVYGVLMMCHMASLDKLLEECRKLESYGAEAVMLMDSAGALLPKEVTEKVGMLVDRLSIPVGFHAHNNLGLAIANSIAAVEAGATILDGTARGFGAGAGNAQLEVIVAVLDKLGYLTGIDLYKVIDAADLAEKEIMEVIPAVKSISIVSGLSGVFSGFAIHVNRVAKKYGVDPRDVFFELGRRKVVAGQEDMIIEVAIELTKQGGDHE